MTHIAKVLKNKTTELTLLNFKIKKEGERGIDTTEVFTPKSTEININDRIEIIYDIISVEGASSLYCFQGAVKDESLNDNHGTTTSVTYSNETEFYGKQAVFNGTTSFVSVPDDDTLDLSGVFDIFVWAKWSSTAEQFILSKRSTTTNGFALSVNSTTAGKVKFYIGSDIILSSSSGFNDGDKHLIRVKRDSDNLITLYIDNTSVGTVTSSYDPTNTSVMLIGKDYGGSFFTGALLRLRIYKGENKTDSESSKIFTKINARNIIKFAGFVTKIDIELTNKKIICQSYGKILGEKNVRGEEYTDKTVEYIVEDLINNNTDLSFDDADQPTGLNVKNFVADGKLIDLISDFANYTNRMFFTTPTEDFFFLPVSFNDTGKTFTHGTGVIIEKSALDDAKLVNSLTLTGEISKYDTVESFNGTGTATVFTLLYNSTSIKIVVGGVQKEPDGVDYSLDSLRKQITFITAPAVGTNNIVVSYEYEIPMVIRGEKPSSIATYGIHSKKLNLSWVNNRTDGVRFVASYLNNNSTIKQNTILLFGEPILYLNENDVVTVVNSFLNINDSFAIKAIEWNFPSLKTEITVGEYRFDYFENEKEIVKKLHDYESQISKSKAIQDYESPEEIIVLQDTVIQYIDELFTETLNIADTKFIRDKSIAVYNSSTYGSYTSGDVYG